MEHPAAARDDAAAQDDRHLWGEYFARRDTPARERLVVRYQRLVRILAAKAYAHRISVELEFDDYLHFGMVGLLECLDRYQPDRGAKFETFASRRITGAILDGVESLSEKQKQVTVRQHVLRERSASLAEGRQPRSDDVLERLAQVAIGLAVGFLLEDTGLYAADEPSYPDNAYSQAELRQLQRRLRATVAELPEQERGVITLHYLQQWPFDQIAIEWSLTKGRISQIHHSALRRLRQALSP